jgi:hypothetical protein
MMCIACEQDFMWLAYLESRGRIGPDRRAAVPEPFAVADKPRSAEIGQEGATGQEAEAAHQKKFSCDDPTAG